ncbi:MAG TPA: carboxylating nicotinate-nucleotide diphosphorylase [Thermodesulfovibrionales bacterium]|nr:carboxylating nicotinate-nucleotide diphosphorylase [Thermodesulfovibrionales bacterium]
MYIPHHVKNILRLALEEDVGISDITTTLLIPEGERAKALLVAKGSFIMAGMPFVQEVFALVDPQTQFRIYFCEGSRTTKGDIIAEIAGNTRALLSCERVGLNVLQRLSGIATLTNLFVEKMKGLNVKIVDTRKTTPGLRFIEKYAVRTGGGSNHRFGLFDGILIKDNHLEAAGGITAAVASARRAHHLSKIEVEVENLNELNEALAAGAEVVMLDNMSLDDMKEAVRLARGKAILEASGNMTLERVRDVAETGVNLISVGALTHSAPAADISMKIVR